MKNKLKGPIGFIKNDKSLLAEVPCFHNGDSESKQTPLGDKKVYIYVEEVFVGMSGDNGEQIIFVPVIPINVIRPERIPVPIFEVEMSSQAKADIIAFGQMNGIEIKMKQFYKPKVSITYDERMEYEKHNEE